MVRKDKQPFLYKVKKGFKRSYDPRIIYLIREEHKEHMKQ